jgi:glycosyltransferase involved in cell wall biosynthesis
MEKRIEGFHQIMTERPICLHVVTSLDFGGVESHMRVIAEHNDIARFEHRFCALGDGGAIAAEIKTLGSTVYVLGAPTKIPSRLAIHRLVSLLRAIHPTVVHLHGAEANFHGLLASLICRVPLRLVEEIGIPKHSKIAKLVFKTLYLSSNGIIAVSNAVKQAIQELGEAKADQIHVILNPAAMLPMRLPLDTFDPFRVGFVGRLEPIKNPIALVRAVAILRDQGLRVEARIVGDGSERSRLEAKVIDLNLEHLVAFEGYCTSPFSFLENCHICVQPSVSEGLGLAIIESMSAGLPVVGTNIGGIPEVITDGHDGWLAREPSARSIAETIKSVIDAGPSALAHVAQCGRESVLQRFSAEAYLGSCEGLYNTLLKTRV